MAARELGELKQAALVVHPALAGAEALGQEIQAHLEAAGVGVHGGRLSDEEYRQWLTSEAVDLLIALGGDGTMLRAGELSAVASVPVLGINLGRVGFLMEVTAANWREALDQILAGKCWLEARLRIKASLTRNGERQGEWGALNEAVVGRGRTGRPIRVAAAVDGMHLARYVADGLICATPTGSTAYALAAGGPILPPRLRNMLLVPVAPHLSVDRSLVLPEGSRVSLNIESRVEADLSCDGQVATGLQRGDQVDVEASEEDAWFVRLQDPGYFFHNLTTYMKRWMTNEGDS